MAKMIISETTSPIKDYAIVENGEIKVVLNESTKKKGYMPMSEAKGFMHSLIKAKYNSDKMLTENGKPNVKSDRGYNGLIVQCYAQYPNTWDMTDVMRQSDADAIWEKANSIIKRLSFVGGQVKSPLLKKTFK